MSAAPKIDHLKPPITLIPESIPQELKEIEQWVCWKAEWNARRGKWDKYPYESKDPNKKAKANDPGTWSSYEDTLKTYKQGVVDGIGFVFTADDGLVFIDLDSILDHNGNVLPFFQFLVHVFGSYAETSCSGKGLHIICRGAKPGTKCKSDPYEVYEHGRFCAITGSLYGGHFQIREAIRPVNALYYHVFLSKNREHKESVVSNLWTGNYPHKSPSEADLALCRYLKFWLDDESENVRSRIEQVFSKSALYRDKWDRDDYRERTLNEIFGPGASLGGGTPATSIRKIEATAPPRSEYSVNEFKDALKGLNKEKFTNAAYELIDNFAQLPKSEVNKIRPFLKKGGMTARDIIDWQQAVRNTIKEQRENEPKQSDPSKGVVPRLGEYFMNCEHFAVDVGDRLWYYKDGVYHPKGKKYISMRVMDTLDEWGLSDLWSQYRISEVVAYVKMYAPKLWENYPEEYKYKINIMSGILDLETQEISEHSPDFLSAVQFPIEYNKEAKADKWDKFYSVVFPDDAYQAGIHWQLACWALVSTNPGQKAVLAIGNGNDGKSRFLKSFENMVGGSVNTSHLSLQTIGNNRFAVTGLIGKALNICADLPSAHLADTSIFKALCDGEETVGGEYKGGDFFDFNNRCKLMFSANQVPGSSDNTDGYFRRWLILPMNAGQKIDPKDRKSASVIDKELSLPEQLSGVLNKILEVAPRVLKRGVEQTDSMKEAHAEFIAAVDSFAVWDRDNLYKESMGKVLFKHIMGAYREHCTRKQLPMKKAPEVKKYLFSKYKGIEWGEVTDKHGDTGEGFTGLVLRVGR